MVRLPLPYHASYIRYLLSIPGVAFASRLGRHGKGSASSEASLLFDAIIGAATSYYGAVGRRSVALVRRRAFDRQSARLVVRAHMFKVNKAKEVSSTTIMEM